MDDYRPKFAWCILYPLSQNLLRVIGLSFGVVLISWVAHTQCVYAQSPDDEWDAVLQQFCGDVNEKPFSEITPEEAELCSNLADSGPSSGGSTGPRVSTNVTVLGALGSVSNSMVMQHREGVEQRLDELNNAGTNSGHYWSGIIGGSAGEDSGFDKWGAFAVARYTESDREQTIRENGYDSELRGLTLGIDYRLSDSLVAGLALGVETDEVDFDSGAGTLDTESWAATVYANYIPVDNTYFDVYLGFAKLDYETRRATAIGTSLSGTAKGDTNGDQILAGVAAGYTWISGAWSLTPYLGIDYSKTDIDGYTETDDLNLALSYNSQRIKSVTSQLGITANYTTSMPWGVLIPYGRLEWAHEYKDDSRRIPSSLALDSGSVVTVQTDNPDRDYLRLAIGAQAVMTHGVQAFIEYERLESHDYLDTWTVTGSLRVEF